MISGRVQGVFYRSETRKTAQRLGLSGWVRNLANGDVEAVFEGDGDTIARMLEWCKTGPPSARVEKVDADWEEPRKDVEGFEIRYS